MKLVKYVKLEGNLDMDFFGRSSNAKSIDVYSTSFQVENLHDAIIDANKLQGIKMPLWIILKYIPQEYLSTSEEIATNLGIVL